MMRLTLGVATCTVLLFWGLYHIVDQSPREQLVVRSSPPSQRLKVSAEQQQQREIIPNSGGESFAGPDTAIPPLGNLIESGKKRKSHNEKDRIVAPVDFLLDFAIVGYAKTATTFVLNWLGHHPDIRMHPYEVHYLTKHDPVGMVQSLYQLQEQQYDQRRHYGYKAPRDIADATTMQLLATYWPKTKLIIGIRHPVLWFQSFYNYRLITYPELPPPSTLVGPCQIDVADDSQLLATVIAQHEGLHDRGVCTDLARFHVHLRSHLLIHSNNSTTTITSKPRHPVFLYVDEQFRDEQHVAQLQEGLQTFLGLSTPLSNPIDFRSHMSTTASNSASTTTAKAFDICQSDYTELRARLLEIGREASRWLIDHFVPLPGVTVACSTCVVELLETWHVDPCEGGTQ